MLRFAHGITLIFIEGFIIAGFLAIFEYGQEADARLIENSTHPNLNGNQQSDAPRAYFRKYTAGSN